MCKSRTSLKFCRNMYFLATPASILAKGGKREKKTNYSLVRAQPVEWRTLYDNKTLNLCCSSPMYRERYENTNATESRVTRCLETTSYLSVWWKDLKSPKVPGGASRIMVPKQFVPKTILNKHFQTPDNCPITQLRTHFSKCLDKHARTKPRSHLSMQTPKTRTL